MLKPDDPDSLPKSVYWIVALVALGWILLLYFFSRTFNIPLDHP